MKLYVVNYFGLNKDGDEIFNFVYYYTDSSKAKEQILNIANNFYKKTLATYLYHSHIDLYTHLKVYTENNGEFKYLRSAIVSYSDGQKGVEDESESLETREIVINRTCELFKTL